MSHRNGKPKPHASTRTKMRWNIRKNTELPKATKTINDVITPKVVHEEDGFQSINTEF